MLSEDLILWILILFISNKKYRQNATQLQQSGDNIGLYNKNILKGTVNASSKNINFFNSIVYNCHYFH